MESAKTLGIRVKPGETKDAIYGFCEQKENGFSRLNKREMALAIYIATATFFNFGVDVLISMTMILCVTP
jgi:ubiquinone biosynthesis protein COQ9